MSSVHNVLVLQGIFGLEILVKQQTLFYWTFNLDPQDMGSLVLDEGQEIVKRKSFQALTTCDCVWWSWDALMERKYFQRNIHVRSFLLFMVLPNLLWLGLGGVFTVVSGDLVGEVFSCSFILHEWHFFAFKKKPLILCMNGMFLRWWGAKSKSTNPAKGWGGENWLCTPCLSNLSVDTFSPFGRTD